MPTMKGAETSLSYVQCFLYLVSSSINVSFSYYMAGYLLDRCIEIFSECLNECVLLAVANSLILIEYGICLDSPVNNIKKVDRSLYDL